MGGVMSALGCLVPPQSHNGPVRSRRNPTKAQPHSTPITIASIDNQKSQELSSQFRPKYPRPLADVRIAEVTVKQKVLAKYQQQQQSMEHVRPKDAHAGMGNAVRRFHGTSYACGLGLVTSSPCDGTGCAICSIIRHGFDITKARNGTYGRGIYSSSSAGKAVSYCKGGYQGYKAMLVCEVLAGYTTQGGKSPGPNRHSVMATSTHDELVVYASHHIIPRYLIVFRDHGLAAPTCTLLNLSTLKPVTPPSGLAYFPCTRVGCKCTSSHDGKRGSFCSTACRDGQPCGHNAHATPPHWSKCARAACPCTKPYRGLPGNYCSTTCMRGRPCTSLTHV